MDRNEARNIVQQRAADKWEQQKFIGTLNMHTGSGKNFAAFRCILKLPKGTKVQILAEVVDRKGDIYNDIKKFNTLFNLSIDMDYEFSFMTYQSAANVEGKSFDLVWADEIHDGITGKRHLFFKNNSIKYKLGTSATLSDNVKYNDPELVSKKYLLDKICPIIFKYTMEDGRKMGTSRKLNVFIVKHTLDRDDKYVQAGNKKKRFFVTEKNMYDYISESFDDAWQSGKRSKAKILAMRRSNFLYGLKSKDAICKDIISFMEGKTILFGNSITALERILPGKVISSRRDEANNEAIRESFESGEIDCIGAFKKLEQGANIKGSVDNTVIHSYYSKADKYKQRVGRSRIDGDKLGNTVLIVTIDSKERDWAKNLLEIYPRDLYNVTVCEDVIDFKHKYVNREMYENRN